VKNKMSDLRNHLFVQMERLNDEGLAGKRLLNEIKRAQALTHLAREIIASSGLVLKGRIAVDNSISGGFVLPSTLDA